MPKRFSLFVFVVLSVWLSVVVQAGPSLEELKSYPAEAAEMLVYSTGFEMPKSPEFSVSPGNAVTFVRGKGCNGNTALRIEGNKEPYLFINLKEYGIQDGCKYQVKLFVRGKTHSTDGVKHSSYRFISVRFRDPQTKKILPWREYGVFPFASYLDDQDDIDAFHEFTFDFYGIPNAEPFLWLSVGEGGPFEGVVYFDDLRVYQCGVDSHVNLVTPKMETFLRGSRDFSFYGFCPTSQTLAMSAEFVNAATGETLQESRLELGEDGFFHGQIPDNMKPGQYLFRTTLADWSSQKRLKVAEFPVNIRPADEVPPKGAVSFDEKNQLLVDGKPFFAFSLGCDEPSPAGHLKVHADAGFNVMDTGPFHLSNCRRPDHAQHLREVMDEMDRLGMKVRLSLTDFYNRTELCVQYEPGIPGILKLVNEIKDHPALLGYYLLDELTEKDWPMVAEIRNAVNQADPYHPCFICTNLLTTTPKITITGDVIGYDYYPIGLKGKVITDATNVDKMAMQVRATGSHFLAIPQAFCWAVYQPEKTAEVFQRYQQPTVNQMLADALLFAVNGVTDFWFYICPLRKTHVKYCEKVGVPGYSEELFADITAMATHMRKLEEYLMADSEPEMLPVENLGISVVRAYRYQNAQGRSAVVILAEGQGAASARITLPNDAEWSSDCGLTTQDMDGAWLFQADGFAADVMYQK